MAGVSYLRDGHMNIIAQIQTESNGDQKIFNKHLTCKGKYDAKLDCTYDAHMRCVGKGNLLTTLIMG